MYRKPDVEEPGVTSVEKNYVVGCFLRRVHFSILTKIIIGDIHPHLMILVQVQTIVQVDTILIRISPLHQDPFRGLFREPFRGLFREPFRGLVTDQWSGISTIKVGSRKGRTEGFDLQNYQSLLRQHLLHHPLETGVDYQRYQTLDVLLTHH